MSRVEQIEGQIKTLNQDELKVFREWFAHYDAELWDSQIEAGANNGKLLTLAERALRDHETVVRPGCEAPRRALIAGPGTEDCQPGCSDWRTKHLRC